MLGSGSITFVFTAHTLLLSREPCHVAFPLRGGNDARLRAFVDALEVGDDLELLPEEI